MNLCNFIDLPHYKVTLVQGIKGTLVLIIMTEMNLTTNTQAYPLQGETPLVKMRGDFTTSVPLTYHLVSLV